VLQRDSLTAELQEKALPIFSAFGRELELVQAIYEEQKHAPPKARNMPPVAGNIAWARNLLSRIDGPMRRFEASYSHVFASKEGKAIVKHYNRVARTLIAYEVLWYNAWLDSIESSKAGLQATLLVRHPADNQLYVNFDAEILQLIREAKALARMNLAVPESALVVVLQEEKFKRYFFDLSSCLREYARIVALIVPVTAPLLRPAVADLEHKLRPGMITLTWTSMNIDMYRQHILTGLRRLEELVQNVIDIVENRIETNLRSISRMMLVQLPQNKSFSLDDFVALQQEHVSKNTADLKSKNVEVERAVRDLIELIVAYPVDAHVAPVEDGALRGIVEHYNHFMNITIMHCVKVSLNALKNRVSSRTGAGSERPFFEL